MDLSLKSRRSYKNISQHKSSFSGSKRINMLNIINRIQFSYYSSYIFFNNFAFHIRTGKKEFQCFYLFLSNGRSGELMKLIPNTFCFYIRHVLINLS